MKLSNLIEKAGLKASASEEITVTGFAIDHRKVAPGTVFGAFRGARFNAEDFIPAAIESGAVAVVPLAERPLKARFTLPATNHVRVSRNWLRSSLPRFQRPLSR